MELWEILVPASKSKKKFTYEHHKAWDDFVKSISGGLTVLKTGKGQWISPEGILHIDRVIPCRIICSRQQIERIVNFTLAHYEQEAVLAYKISDEVILKHRNDEYQHLAHMKDACYPTSNGNGMGDY